MKETKIFFDLKVIKKLMLERGIDSKKLAKLAKVNISTINRFLNGADQRKMHTLNIVKISRALNTSVESLLFDEFKKK